MSISLFTKHLNLAVEVNSLVEAAENLKIAKGIVQTRFSEGLVTEECLVALSKISKKFGYQLALEIAKFYKVLSETEPKIDSVLMFRLCCDIHLLCEHLNGTDIGYVLREICKEELSQLITSPTLSNEQHSVIHQILDSSPSLQTPILNLIVEEIAENNPFGMNRLMDYFCSMDSIRDQYFRFPKFMQPVIAALNTNLSTEEGIDREIMLKLLEVLEHFVFRYNFNIQLSGYDKSSPQYSRPYTISEIKLLSIYDDIFSTIMSILTILSSADVLITQNLITIFHRLWNIYPPHRSELFDMIFANLKEVAAGGTEEAKTNSTHFVMSMLQNKDTSPDFKGRLESEEMLSNFFQHETFESYEDIFELGEPTELDSLQLIVGFPLCANIPSGGQWTHLIEVPEAKCILSWGFATENYDLSFNLQRVDLPEAEIMISQQKVRCDESPASGIRLLNSSGLYMFTWSNSYSWFRSKHLRYKIFLLKPFKAEKQVVSKDLKSIINIISERSEVRGVESLEIGVQVKENILRLTALDPNSSDIPSYILEEVSYLEKSEIALCISEFSDELLASNPAPISSIKLGIVQKNAEYIEGIEDLGNVAMSRDIHAVALLSQDNLQAHTLIAIIYEDGLRSCVVLKGKILLNENGESMGDLASFRDIDPAQGIGILLCMFGPAVVVLTGESFGEDLSTLIASIRGYVPPEIWKESSIRESIYKTAAAVQSAAKLHYLHFKYKFAM